MPGRDQKKRVSVDRCKMYHNLSDDSDVPNYLPAGLSKYVLHSFMGKYLSFNPTAEDVVVSRMVVSRKAVNIEMINKYQLVRGRGCKLAVMYEAHWKGLSLISWEREID